MGLAWNLKAIVKLYKTSKGLLTCLLAGEFFCKDMTILLQPYVLFIIGVNITSVIEKFFREPVSAQFDQLKSITLKYVLVSQLDFRNFSGSFNNKKMLLEKILCSLALGQLTTSQVI